MDKKQATQHTLNRLLAGYNTDEITDELSRLLKAPSEVTKRFVEQVIADHPEAIPALPPIENNELPEWMQPISAVFPNESDGAQVDTPSHQTTDSDLPPNLLALLSEKDAYVAPSITQPDQEPAESAGMDLPRQANFVPSDQITENAKDGDESQAADLEELAEYVLEQLKKQRRYNDIVETVCHRTGWHWNKSQRFVARVKTKNHEQLQSRQNRVTIIIGIAIIIVGLLMTLNGASTIADYAKIATFARTNPEALLSISPQPIIFALAATVTGLGMIVGGGFGIGRAMTGN
jgi:hypothetical protein